jgi:hypothetical protein
MALAAAVVVVMVVGRRDFSDWKSHRALLKENFEVTCQNKVT